MNDELRDYRFYAADMIHPSDVAANHIYRRFLQSQCDDATTALADECTRFTRRLRHRPMKPERAMCSSGFLQMAYGWPASPSPQKPRPQG